MPTLLRRMKPAIFDKFERSIPCFFRTAIVWSHKAVSTAVSLRTSSITCVHYTSTDNHASRMTVVISGQLPSTLFIAIFAATQCSTVTTIVPAPSLGGTTRPAIALTYTSSLLLILDLRCEVHRLNQDLRNSLGRASRGPAADRLNVGCESRHSVS